MSRVDNSEHKNRIVEQFSQQAIPFARLPGHLDSMRLLVELSGVTGNDHVLDVACGPGLVACELAQHAATVSGIDLTPAMIGQAEKRQREQGLHNISWHVGSAVPLPFPDESFSLVITRYSFHHFLEPEKALAEMIRVCQPGGRVLVADVATEPPCSIAYDAMEVMRDPSHVHALTVPEFEGLVQSSGLFECRRAGYGVELELESQLAASFPAPGDKERLRELIIADFGINKLGINVRREEGKVVYTVPIAVFAGKKAN